MPKFIGRRARSASTQIENNATTPRGYTGLRYAQQIKIPAGLVRYSLNTSDKGGINSYAKRWYNWFAPATLVRLIERYSRSGGVCADGAAKVAELRVAFARRGSL